MRAAVLLSALAVIAATAAAPAVAIEPQAPDKLISPEEAVLISIRLRLVRAQLPAKPTQTEKGDAIDRNGLVKFYAALGDEPTEALRRPLWVGETGLNEQAKAAIRELANAAEWGLPPEAFRVPKIEAGSIARPTAREMVDLEMQMSLAILKYARYARGGRMDPTDLSLDIDRNPPLLPASDVLGGARNATDVAKFLQQLHPKHDQFHKLRAAYLTALKEEAGGVTRALGRAKLSNRLLYNMEMWRWMPASLGSVYIMPNIPEFRIRVVRDGRIIHSERIVAGKPTNKTPIFSDELETVVFRPFWGVPDSIKVKEILPKIMRGQSIERQGLRVQYGGRDIDPRSVNWGGVDIRQYHVYQPAGSANALGMVKFLFPNKHMVYFHDTPSKQLFNSKVRAFSHGCVRVRDPMKMAEVIFNQDRGWARAQIDTLAGASVDDNRVSLNTKIPVHMTYFTASVSNDGEVKLVPDIYGHEKLIQIGFDGRAHTIVKENRSLDKYIDDDLIGSSGRDGGQYAYDPPVTRDRSWMQQVWGNN